MPIPAEFHAELQKHFAGDLRFDLASRVLYSTDASIYQIEPLGVVFPKNQEDLHAVVELAGKFQVPILPRGSGTSLAGQAIGQALILDCSRWLNRLVDLDPEQRTATVEPGLILSSLNAAAEEHGLIFGPDPASAERATMGGVIGNNATGAHSILYGMAVDHLHSANVLYSDGSIAVWGAVKEGHHGSHGNGRHEAILAAAERIRTEFRAGIQNGYPQTWRNSAGYRLNYLLPWSRTKPPQWSEGDYPPVQADGSYNLAALLAGSEGTLAIIREATVKLVRKPAYTILGVMVFDSIAQACDDVPRILECNPSAIELIPQMLLRLARTVPAYASQMGWVAGDPAALLVVEFSGSEIKPLRQAAQALGISVLVAESAADQQRIWNVRKVGLGIFDSSPADARPIAFIEDCAIPVENLGEFVREVERILLDHGTTAAFYAHASAGCLHIRPILDLKGSAGRKNLRSIAEATFALTNRLGGAMSSEHGDGIARAEFLREAYGAEILEAMRLLKDTADPEGLLNPGKMLGAPPLDSHLRHGDQYRARPWPPALDFARNNQLAGAIEQCNGQGVCRKDGGVMCPSFQATREEIYSTRGRANLLRALINSGGTAEKNDPDLWKAVWGSLDLCLACKGCKSECPSSVDMAKLKYEFQHEYYRTHHRQVRDYLFAFIGEFAKAGAAFGTILNPLFASRPLRGIINSALRISSHRQLPAFSGRRIGGPQLSSTEPRDCVLFLRDTFTHFFEAEIEQSVLRVLSACGISVKIVPGFGAGRALLSKGFISQARRRAEQVLSAVAEIDSGGAYAVVGIEPSELYTLRDEWFDLLPGRHREVEALARRAWLVDEYLVRPGEDGLMRVLRVANANEDEQVALAQGEKLMLHGHCYQKAQPPAGDDFPVGQEASAELLRSVGFDVQIIPSGCCGMAGAFGYEKEHYDLSMQVGELELLPAVRKGHAEGCRIAAAGTSCRSQIVDGAGVDAKHPLQYVSELIDFQFLE